MRFSTSITRALCANAPNCPVISYPYPNKSYLPSPLDRVITSLLSSKIKSISLFTQHVNNKLSKSKIFFIFLELNNLFKIIFPPHFPFADQIERLAFQPDMPPFQKIIHGIEDTCGTAAIPMRLMEHRIGPDFTHQLIGTGQRPFECRTDLFRPPNIYQIRSGVRIPERHDRLVEEHEFQNDGRTVA